MKPETSAVPVAAQEPAQPVAWMWQHDETGMTGFVEHASPEDHAHWERMNKPRKIVTPLYAVSPAPAAPDVVKDAERIDAIERNGWGIECDMEGEWNLVRYRRYGGHVRFEAKATLRAAIDAAIAASGAPQQPVMGDPAQASLPASSAPASKSGSLPLLQAAHQHQRAETLRAALVDIAESKSLTATPTQFYQHLQRVARSALTDDAMAECGPGSEYEQALGLLAGLHPGLTAIGPMAQAQAIFDAVMAEREVLARQAKESRAMLERFHADRRAALAVKPPAQLTPEVEHDPLCAEPAMVPCLTCLTPVTCESDRACLAAAPKAEKPQEKQGEPADIAEALAELREAVTKLHEVSGSALLAGEHHKKEDKSICYALVCEANLSVQYAASIIERATTKQEN